MISSFFTRFFNKSFDNMTVRNGLLKHIISREFFQNIARQQKQNKYCHFLFNSLLYAIFDHD